MATRKEKAANLLRVVERFTGPDSDTLKWAKEKLAEGHSPEEVGEAIVEKLQSIQAAKAGS